MISASFRRCRRLAASFLVVTAVTGCDMDRGSGGSPMLVHVAVRPVLPLNYSFFANNLTIGQVRITLTRLPSTVVGADTRPFPADSAQLRFAMTAQLAAARESLLAVVDYQTAQGVTLFTGQIMVEATTGTPAAIAPFIQLTYSGPGGNIAALSITPLNDTVNGGDSTLYQITATDSAQQPVTSFYVSWGTSDQRVSINAVGLVRTPDLTKNVFINAVTPNGTSSQATLTILGTSGLGILPDSVEMLLDGQQQFTVDVGPGGPYTWSVNGIDGGNATFGFVDTSGLYVAPAATPSPSSFQVCARVSQLPSQQGCARVLVSATPTAGSDVIVVNDMNLFDVATMDLDSNNRLFAANLVNFQTTGSRNAGRIVMYDRGRASSCFLNQECADAGNAKIDSVIRANGFSIVKVDTLASWANIPPSVKTIFLWNPTVAYTRNDINGFKLFASQGGRIVFLGEHVQFYGANGIATENQFLADMGSQFTNIGAVIACFEHIPAVQIQPHQTTGGLSDILIDCASEAVPGPNDFPLFFEVTGRAVGGVAKISTVPLPSPLAVEPPAAAILPPVSVPAARGGTQKR